MTGFVEERDHALAVLTLFGEASGEPYEGKLAVAWVLQNRLRNGKWGATLAAVCLSPQQFSCWLPGADRVRMVTGAERDYSECCEALGAVLTGSLSDSTEGAEYYFTDSIPAPSWSSSMRETVHIGHHRFFKEG